MKSILNIRSKKSLKVIGIAKIIGSAEGFKIFVDQYGIWHRINKSDFPPEKWRQIKEGSELGIPTQEVAKGVILLSEKPTKTGEEKIIPDANLLWYCDTCGAKAGIDTEEINLENLENVAREIYEEHQRISDDCGHFVVIIAQIVFNEMVINEKLSKMIAFELSKP